MLRYDMSRDTRKAMAPHARLVQGAIAVLANRQLGGDETPHAIFKTEGGVVVNRREIAIKSDYVIDDFRKDTAPTPEEEAVVAAIQGVQEIWDRDGAAGLAAFSPPEMGDPLRSMFETRW